MPENPKGVYAQRKELISALEVKATNINKQVRRMINNLKTDNYKVENQDLLRITQDRIKEIASKEKPTEKDVQRMKEYASITMYDVGIKIEMKVPDARKNGIQTQSSKWISFGELRLALGRELRFALSFNETDKYGNTKDISQIDFKLSEKDISLISQYAQTLIHDQNITPQQDRYIRDIAADAATSEQWRRHNVQIGSYSALLNDLSYTFGAYRLGTEFVIKMQGIMSNKVNFDMIEGWYKSKEGRSVKRLIDESVNKYWYEGFLSFSVAIIEAINSMPNLDRKSNQILSDMQQKAEIIADEEMSY